MTAPTWSILVSYRDDGTISSIHRMETTWLNTGGPYGDVRPRTGDHVLGPFVDSAAAERAMDGVLREMAEDGTWRLGALLRLQYGLVVPVETWPLGDRGERV